TPPGTTWRPTTRRGTRWRGRPGRTRRCRWWCGWTSRGSPTRWSGSAARRCWWGPPASSTWPPSRRPARPAEPGDSVRLRRAPLALGVALHPRGLVQEDLHRAGVPALQLRPDDLHRVRAGPVLLVDGRLAQVPPGDGHHSSRRHRAHPELPLAAV